MSFQPIIPLAGVAGWQYIQRTQETQQEAYSQSPIQKREIEYFRENISKATTAEELVSDRTLLKVALGAFGLDDDLNKQAYVRKVLEEGTDADDAFANRMPIWPRPLAMAMLRGRRSEISILPRKLSSNLKSVNLRLRWAIKTMRCGWR